MRTLAIVAAVLTFSQPSSGSRLVRTFDEQTQIWSRHSSRKASPAAKPYATKFPLFTSKGQGAPGKAHGLWNPDPALVSWASDVHKDSIKLEILLASQTNTSVNRSHFPPKKSDWAWGTSHWPSFYYDFAPQSVVDLCGGTAGMTKWKDVSDKCARWTVNMLKCYQGCNFMNRFQGFGKCMTNCGGYPITDWCNEASDPKIVKHCNMFVGRWEICQVSKEPWPDTDSWFSAIDTCVFNCATSMETEMHMGQSFEWRNHKCNPVWYSCGTFKDPYQCTTTDPVLCEGPVGQGTDVCWYDDPWCADKDWGCYPAPDPEAKTTKVTMAMPNHTQTTIVSIFNDTGGFVMNATMPRLPYVKQMPAPDWFTIVRPTPFAPASTNAPTTPAPGCVYNYTKDENGTEVVVNTTMGTWNGSSCNLNGTSAKPTLAPEVVFLSSSLKRGQASPTLMQRLRSALASIEPR